MNMMTIEDAERDEIFLSKILDSHTESLKKLLEKVETFRAMKELRLTQIASARIDGKKEFDADTYMKGKKK